MFLPGLGRKVRNDNPPLLRWLQLPADDGSQDLLMAVHSIGEQVSSDPLSAYIRQLQKLRQDNERRRLAYVAVTRARGQLYLSGHAPWIEKEQLPRPDSRSQLHILWPAVKDSFIAAAGAGPTGQEAASAAQRGPGRALVSPRCRLCPRTATTNCPRSNHWLPGRRHPERDRSSVGPVPWREPPARWCTRKWNCWPRSQDPGATDFTARIPLYMVRLRELGVEGAAARTTATDIAARMTAVIRDPKARWLLSSQHREAHSELRLTGVLDGQIRNVVIDRSFVDEQGVRWVIDYKTSSHSGGDLAGFLAEERERYRSQLELYVRLAQWTWQRSR